MKLLAYARISEESENIENQKFAILEFVAKNGHVLLDFFEDVGVSGALPPRSRRGFSKILEKLDEADGIVVYALDRIARSLNELVDVVKEIESKGKVVISVRESWLNTLDPRIRNLIIAILGWASEMEREFIKERTREALRRLRAQGKKLGRPKIVNEKILDEALKYLQKGYRLKDVAKILNVGYTTLARALTQNEFYRVKYYEMKKFKVK